LARFGNVFSKVFSHVFTFFQFLSERITCTSTRKCLRVLYIVLCIATATL